MLQSQPLTGGRTRAQRTSSAFERDVETLLTSTYDDLKRYVGFSAPDEVTLAEALPFVDPKLAGVADAFYARVLAHPEAAAVVGGEAQLIRQKNTLCDYLRRFFSEPRDEAYLQRLMRAGKVHVGIGLSQRYVIAGISMLRELLAESMAPTPTAASVRRAVERGLDLDLAVMVESYAAAELERAQEAERRANAERAKRLESTGILTAGLAHEIRNPLNGAQLHLTFLRRRVEQLEAGAEVVEAVDVASREIKRVATLLTELLSFAAPPPPNVAFSDLRDVCHTAATIVREEAVRDGVQLDVTLPSSPLEAWVDVARVTEVVVGVLRNAFEAIGGTGGASGSVRLRAMRGPGAIIIEIEDDGPGVGSPNSPVFEPFYTTKANGSGLGLSIAHRVLSDHGGELTFSSTPGRTIFRLQFPDQRTERVK